MAPLRLAGSMSLGARAPTSADLVFDGEINGAAVKLNARLDGGPSGWRTGPADLTALVEGADAGAIAALLAPGRSPDRGGNPGPGRLLVKASGVPAQGLATLASVDAGGLALSFRGQVTRQQAAIRLPASWRSRPRTARASPRSPAPPPLRLMACPLQARSSSRPTAAGSPSTGWGSTLPAAR
jgi:hypothetical protein